MKEVSMKKKSIVFAVFLAAMLLASAAASAEDAAMPSDEDIFATGAFDEAVTAGETASDTVALSWLGGLTLVADNSFLWLEKQGNYGDAAGFNGKAFLKATKPDAGAFFVSYAFSHTLLQATNDDGLKAVYARFEPSLVEPKFELSELHLSFDVNKVVFVRVGNQLLSWGSSYFWSPADFVNEKQADSQAAVDTRTGKSGLRLHMPIGSSNLFFFGDYSRSLDASGMARDLTKTAGYAFRADAILFGFSTGLLGAFGPDESTRLGLSTSGSLFGLDVWGEAGSVLPLGGDAFAVATSLGGEKTFGINSEWNVRGEGFWNPDGADDAELSMASVDQSKLASHRLGKYYAYLSGTRLKLFGGSSSLGLSGIMNMSDLSYTAATTLGLNLPKLIPLNVSLRYSGGREGREFTVGSGGPSWQFGVQSVLQF